MSFLMFYRKLFYLARKLGGEKVKMGNKNDVDLFKTIDIMVLLVQLLIIYRKKNT